MKKLFLMGAGILALAGVALIHSLSASAASDTYKFTIRGTATEVDKANKTVSIATTHTSGQAKDDLAGSNIEFNVAGAKFFKYDKAGKKVRTTIGNIPVGNEVVAKGAKRGEDRYNISELTVNGNDFSLVGTVKDYSIANKIITVTVTSSTYKEASLKGKDIKVYYGNNTKFRNSDSHDINSDELADNGERVKITGTVVNSWKFEALTVIDGYTKAK